MSSLHLTSPKFFVSFWQQDHVSHWAPLLWDNSCKWLSSCLAKVVVWSVWSVVPLQSYSIWYCNGGYKSFANTHKMYSTKGELLCKLWTSGDNIAFQYRVTDCKTRVTTPVGEGCVTYYFFRGTNRIKSLLGTWLISSVYVKSYLLAGCWKFVAYCNTFILFCISEVSIRK